MKKCLSLAVGIISTIAAAAIWTGCGGASVSAPESAESGEIDRSSWQIGRRGGSMTLAVWDEIVNLFPVSPITNIGGHEVSVIDILFLPPLDRDYLNGRWTGVLAESWSVSDDGKTVTVTLRDDAEWSDGQPVTSRDVVEPVELFYRSGSFESLYTMRFSRYGEDAVYAVIDDKRFTITMPEASTSVFPLLALPALPMHVLKPVLDREGPEGFYEFWLPESDLEEVVVSGPFLPAEYHIGEKIVLKRNPRFFMKDEKGRKLPYLEEVTILFNTEGDAAVSKFEAGELDWLMTRAPNLIEHEEEWQRYTIQTIGERASATFLCFNQNPIEGPEDEGIGQPKLTWFSNKDFRKAMAHIINRQRLIEEVARGKAAPQYSFVQRSSPYYWEEADAYALKYDPAEAAELLDAIGYHDRDGDGIREDPEGNTIAFALITNQENEFRVQTGRIIAEEARGIGIQADFQPVEFSELVGMIVESKDFEAMIIGTVPMEEPLTDFEIYHSSGFQHIIEPGQEQPRRDWERRMDELVEQAPSSLTFEQRRGIYEEAQKIWLDELPWIFTITELEYQIHRGEFGNLKPHLLKDYRLPLHRIYRKRR